MITLLDCEREFHGDILERIQNEWEMEVIEEEFADHVNLVRRQREDRAI